VASAGTWKPTSNPPLASVVAVATVVDPNVTVTDSDAPKFIPETPLLLVGGPAAGGPIDNFAYGTPADAAGARVAKATTRHAVTKSRRAIAALPSLDRYSKVALVGGADSTQAAQRRSRALREKP
jgi:hypothetical protein